MELSDDQIQAETKRNIALYVGGIGSVVFGVVFLLFISFLIQRDNWAKTRKRADANRRESALQKKRIEEQQLEEKSKKAKQPIESSDSEDEGGDTSQTTSSMPNNNKGELNGFFRRQSIAIIAPLGDTQDPYTNDNIPKDARELIVSQAEPGVAYKIPQICEPTHIEVPKSGRKESLVVFKDNLAAALQLHMQNQRRDSNASSRRPSTVDEMLSLNVDSCGSSVSNSRRTSAVDSPAFPQSSKSSRANSRRPSAVNAQEIRPLPDYESLKFVPGMTGFDDSNELPRFASVIGKSRRESLDSQLGFQDSHNLAGERGIGKTAFDLSKMESSTDPTPKLDYPSNDFLPAIPESPHPSQKHF